MFPDPQPARSAPRAPDEQAARRPIFYKEVARSWPPEQQSAVPPQAQLPLAARDQTPVGQEPPGRICLRIARSELKTAASGKVIVISGAMKSATNMSRTIRATSGRKTPAGLLSLLPVPSRGQVGVR